MGMKFKWECFLINKHLKRCWCVICCYESHGCGHSYRHGFHVCHKTEKQNMQVKANLLHGGKKINEPR